MNYQAPTPLKQPPTPLELLITPLPVSSRQLDHDLRRPPPLASGAGDQRTRGLELQASIMAW